MRVHPTCTGRPTALESRAASTATSLITLRPKPPPTVGVDHLHTHTVSVAEHAAILRARLAGGLVVLAALAVGVQGEYRG